MLVAKKKKLNHSSDPIPELIRVVNLLDMYALAQRQVRLSFSFVSFFNENILEELTTCLAITTRNLEHRLQSHFPDIYEILQDFIRLRRRGELSNNRAIFNFIAQRAWNYFDNVILTEENILRVVRGLGYVKIIVSMSITIAIAVEFPPAAIFLIPPLLNLVGLPVAGWLAEKLDMPAIKEGAEVVVNAINWAFNPIGSAVSKVMQLLTDKAADLIIDHYEIKNDRYKCLVRVVSRELGEIASIGLTTGITMGIAQCVAPRVQSFPVPRNLPTTEIAALPPPSPPPLPISGSPSLSSTTNLGSLGNFVKPPQSIYPHYIPEQAPTNPIQGFDFAKPSSLLVDRFMNYGSTTALNNMPFRSNVNNTKNTYNYQKVELGAQIASCLAKLGIEVTKEIVCLYLEYLQNLEMLKQLEIRHQQIKLRNEHLEKMMQMRQQHKQEAIKEKHKIKLRKLERDILIAENNLLNSTEKIENHLLALLKEYHTQSQTKIDLIEILHAEQQLIIYLETHHKIADVELFALFDSVLEHYPEHVKTKLKNMLREDYQRIAKKEKSVYSQTHYKEKKTMFKEIEKKVKEGKKKGTPIGERKSTPIIEFPDEDSEKAIVPQKINDRALRASRDGNSNTVDRIDRALQVTDTGIKAFAELGTAGFSYGETRQKTTQVSMQCETIRAGYESKERILESKLKGKNNKWEHEINVLDRQIAAIKAEKEAKLEERKIDLKSKELELQYDRAILLRDQQIENLKRENARLLRKIEKLEEKKEKFKGKSKEYKKEKEGYKAENAKLERELLVSNIRVTTFGQTSNTQTSSSVTNTSVTAVPTLTGNGL